MGLLRHQADISAQIPMPVSRSDEATTVVNVASEVLSWLYVNGGGWASATGRPAGTIVSGKVKYNNILNSNKATLGSFNNTSLVFSVATRADVRVSIPEEVWAEIQYLSPADQSAKVAEYLPVKGNYAIDHRFGQVWLNSKATVANDTIAYSYKATVGGGGSGGNVNLDEVGGANTATGKGLTDAGTLRVVLADDSPGGGGGSGGGGSAGGGNNTYSTEQNDFSAVITDGTREIVLNVDNLAGEPITEANFANGILKVYQDSTGEVKTITLDKFSWDDSTKTLDVTGSTGSFDFATGDIVSLTLVGLDKQRDVLNNAMITNPIRDISDKFTGEEILNVANIPSNTTGYVYFGMDSFRMFALQCLITSTTDTLTLTVEATWQDDGTLDNACEYTDVTNAWFGSASATSDVVFEKDTFCSAKYVRLKYVTSNGGGNNSDLVVYLRKQY